MSYYIQKYLRSQVCTSSGEKKKWKTEENWNQNLKRNSKYVIYLFCPNTVLPDSQGTHFGINGIKWNELFPRVQKLKYFCHCRENISIFLLCFVTPSHSFSDPGPQSTTWAVSGKNNCWLIYLDTEVQTSYLILFWNAKGPLKGYDSEESQKNCAISGDRQTQTSTVLPRNGI